VWKNIGEVNNEILGIRRIEEVAVKELDEGELRSPWVFKG